MKPSIIICFIIESKFLNDYKKIILSFFINLLSYSEHNVLRHEPKYVHRVGFGESVEVRLVAVHVQDVGASHLQLRVKIYEL